VELGVTVVEVFVCGVAELSNESSEGANIETKTMIRMMVSIIKIVV